MKRPFVESELPGIDLISNKQLSSPSDTDLLDDVRLSWPELLDGVLQLERAQDVADIHTHLEGPGYDAVENLTTTTGLSSTAVEVGRSIERWIESETSAVGADNGEDVQSHKPNSDIGQHPIRLDLKCFGMIHGTSARLIGDMQYLNKRLVTLDPEERTFSVRIRFIDQSAFLMTEDGTRIGQLNDEMTKTLANTSELASLIFEAFADVKNTIQCIHRAKRLHDAVIKIDVNVYGDIADRNELGQKLSTRRVYLQHTLYRKNDFEYDNPHMIDFDENELAKEATSLISDINKPICPTTMDSVIAEVRQAETRDRGLRGLKHSVMLRTSLLFHQEQALDFMVQREVGPIPEEFQLWQQVSNENRTGFQHDITGCWTTTKPFEIGCGILADDMGMGKTLSTLSLITRRLADGRDWSKSQDADNMTSGKSCTRSRATLVVVPSMLIMNLWIKEIEDHLDGSLRIVKHHGNHRHSHFDAIKDCDVVLTTYHTLAAERKLKRSPLKSIEWYRIVLDEAHTIRRQSTTLFRSVAELESCHRWCLTGTPIQNTLTDLGSLLGFLRLAPFDRASMFRKHIDAPFSEDLEAASKKLKTLLDSVCLRRSLDRLHLLPMDERVRHVDLTEEERRHYESTLNVMVRATAYGSRDRFSDTPFGKFQIQLQARIVCNHGTFQRPFAHGQTDGQAQKEDAVSFLGGDRDVRCSICGESTPIIRTNCTTTRENKLSYQTLCDECTLQTCTEAPVPISSAMHGDTTGRCLSTSSDIQQCNPLDTSPRRGFDLNGHSTKIEKLIEDIQIDLTSTKSIVFSCWTRSLNLVAWHLDRCNIRYARIDGDTAIGQRQAILNAFATEEDIRILLMTTGTGAYGLNLAVANRVFILEPQWNPSVENQAIARVQRFGQTQTVKVVRYVVRATVEEDIRRQQTGKAVLAERGFQTTD